MDQFKECSVLATSEQEAKELAKENTNCDDWYVKEIKELDQAKYIMDHFYHA